MENVPPSAMSNDRPPILDLRPKRSTKASRQKRTPALNTRTNADRGDEDSDSKSGLLTPPSSQAQEGDMDASRMLFSPPPEEILRHERNSVIRARSVPTQAAFSPSHASTKRKRHAHNRSSSHTALDSIVNGASNSGLVVTEATPNPKPRKQTKRGALHRQPTELADEPTTPTRASQRRSESPTKRSLLLSPHHSNLNADYIPPLPVISRQTISARRRSATPIPPYEPPRERFTPPREIIHTPPGATHSPEGMSKSSKRKSAKNTKKLVLTIKKEPPEIDLSELPPPPSPSDDPLLLKGLPGHPRKSHPQLAQIELISSTSTPSHARQTPSIASSSPVSPPDDPRGGRLPDLNTSMDLGMDSDDSMNQSFENGPPLFDFSNPQDDADAWDDVSDADGDDDFDQTGDYTGRFKVLTVPTKADPPSSCTRARQHAWGNPSSPFPGGPRRRSLPSSSSPPLKALPEREDGTPSTSPDEEDVFFLDTPVNQDVMVRAEFEEGSSRDTLDAPQETDYSMDIPDIPRESTPMRSPSPLPIVDVLNHSADQSAAHHVRFVAARNSQEDMEVDSLEGAHQQEDLNGPDGYNSDSSDEETVDRELSREPGHVNDSETDEEDRDTRPAPPTIPTPQRGSTPGRSFSSQTGSSRQRGFLSITSPLRRQKSPQVQSFEARSVSPMPSIHSVFTTPAPVYPTEPTNDSSPESATSGSRVRMETSEETVVGESTNEDRGKEDGHVTTDVEDGSGSEGEDLDNDVVKITSADPRVAARAAAILKMHDYDFIVRDMSRNGRHSSVDSAMRKARRRSVVEGGVTKHSTPINRRRTFGGVIGDKVFIPGSPLMTVPQLLQEAEHTVEQREKTMRTPSREASFTSDNASFKIPSLRPSHSRPTFNSNGPRAWEKDDWKLLDACFTDERLARSTHKALGEATLAHVDEIELDNVVNRFLEYTASIPLEECWPGWTRDNLLRRVQALQRKQRAGKGAPPTPSGRFSSVPLSEVPDFTPLPSRQSSVQPGFDRGGSWSSTLGNRPAVPASLLAPRYSHLLDEAIAISRKDTPTQSNTQPVEYRSASVPAPEQCSVSLPPQSPATGLCAESEVPLSLEADMSTFIPPPFAERSIAQRMKGFFWSYLPRATKTTPSSKPVPPKELVQLNHAPPPKPSMIPRLAQQKPKRLVDLHPAPRPPSPARPRSSLSVVSNGDRRSSSGSVKDLVKGFESLEKQQARERAEEMARLRRVRSIGEWAANTGGTLRQGQSNLPAWKP
ncbi:hypothetical protein C8Q74DRAFT_1284238 [Fomes fomentarius]|nr:hypothetical protein C8Q74DRAFT_1284238 [Fomes fomentarius]